MRAVAAEVASALPFLLNAVTATRKHRTGLTRSDQVRRRRLPRNRRTGGAGAVTAQPLKGKAARLPAPRAGGDGHRLPCLRRSADRRQCRVRRRCLLAGAGPPAAPVAKVSATADKAAGRPADSNEG